MINIFYYNSYLHDMFYLLGFREEDGNFQQTGIGSVSGDPVDARAHSGPCGARRTCSHRRTAQARR